MQQLWTMEQLRSLLVLCIVVAICSSKSIQKQNLTLDETQNERLENMERIIKTLENKIEILNTSYSKGSVNDPVMFYAVINSGAIPLNAKSTLVFETVILNVGGHYNKNDGVFVAPREGYYLFSWTVTIDPNDYAVTELVVENKIISTAGETGKESNHRSASMTALCRMQKDEHAFIRTTSYGTTNVFYSINRYPQTSFLGMLVQGI